MPKLSRLRIHPIKSCRGFEVTTATVDELGLAGDRRYQVVNHQGAPFTQRSHAKLAQVSAHYHGDNLVISAADHGDCQVSRSLESSDIIETEVWSARGLRATDCGEDSSVFFSELLGEAARLVCVGNAFNRPVKNNPQDRVGFADAYPLLIISEASLADLNTIIKDNGAEPVPMESFRPNLVVSDCEAYAEDTWSELSIGSTHFRAGGPCERCIMTTLDPQSGAKRGPEPLRTLASYRRDPNGSAVWFGQNLINTTKTGTLQVGDQVSLA
ncbi:MAG: MOSC domain-containing protein [Synoicihabitans sp.]